MKKILFGILVISFFIFISSKAQVRRTVLLEEATNASCPPCAAYNPGLQDFVSLHFGNIISIRYHASWPGKDPMYSFNTTENDRRIQYYGIRSVPTYVIDGTPYGTPSNPEIINEHMLERLEKTSPIKIIIDKSISGGSVTAVVKIFAIGNLNLDNLKLRAAVIERKIEYNSPPGGNGEKIFYDVMRKFLTPTNGENVAQISAGDSLIFNLNTKINSAWKTKYLEVVAWVQDDDNKEVIQSGISLPTFTVKSSVPAASILSLNNSSSYSCMVVNDNTEPLNIHLEFSKRMQSDDWSIKISNNGTLNDSLDVTIPPSDSLNFDLVITTTGNAGYCNVGLVVKNSDDLLNYGYKLNFYGLVPGDKILLVDDDAGEDYENLFIDVLDKIKTNYAVIPVEYITRLLGDNTYEFKTLLWNIGWGFPSLTEDDVDFIKTVLNSGGNLFISGQDIGWDIFDPKGSSTAETIKDFYHNFLDASYVEDDSKIYGMEGIAGSPISDSINFIIYYQVHKRYPDVIKSYSGKGELFLKYKNSTKYGGIAFDNGNFKSVYIGIGFEQILEDTMRFKLLKNILVWFGDVVSVKSDNNILISNSFRLYQNYPNPFNPTTTIKYNVPSDVKRKTENGFNASGVGGKIVTLKVYNVLGKEVATLVNKKQLPGNYKILFNAENLNSGVYFYKLKTGNYSSVKKLILLK